MNKKIAIWVVVLVLIGLTSGCLENKESTLKNVNSIYTNVKMIVNDPTIKSMISDDNWEKLKKTEVVYLAAVLLLTNSEIGSNDEKQALVSIIECADTLLIIVNKLNICERHKTILTTIKLSIGLLKSNL